MASRVYGRKTYPSYSDTEKSTFQVFYFKGVFVFISILLIELVQHTFFNQVQFINTQ